MRIGIDVGGTNTDAVLMDGRTIHGAVKTPTTPNVTDGIVTALQMLVEQTKLDPADIQAVMLGTTHFTNAVVERLHLTPTATIRMALPATEALPPMTDWPEDLRDAIGNHYFLVRGGYEFDGRQIAPFDPVEVRAVAKQILDRGIASVAISCVFSPINNEQEKQAAEIVREVIPNAHITLSSAIGRLGLLERENAAIINACLSKVAERIVAGFKAALGQMDIAAPFYLSQNDGTLMASSYAQEYPVLTFASGPTNSMRGAAFLSGLKDALVIDVGGTTSDVGMLQNGFPRVASQAVTIGGVRTNFRMPDVYSFGLGGGSIVCTEPVKVGPQSVGYELISKGMIFGGNVLTTTDVVVAAGFHDIGDCDRVHHLSNSLTGAVLNKIEDMVNVSVDRMKTSAAPIPVISVGGGSILIVRPISGASEIITPEHHAVANAIGAAIAQVGGEVDRVFSLEAVSREEALNQAKTEATTKAVAAGADPATVEVVDVEEVPLAYLPGNATRIAVKAVGDLAMA
jgi:N-methylhydantoinase A/oxoprolinase/acetone carboxylase beta subunit